MYQGPALEGAHFSIRLDEAQTDGPHPGGLGNVVPAGPLNQGGLAGRQNRFKLTCLIHPVWRSSHRVLRGARDSATLQRLDVDDIQQHVDGRLRRRNPWPSFSHHQTHITTLSAFRLVVVGFRMPGARGCLGFMAIHVFGTLSLAQFGTHAVALSRGTKQGIQNRVRMLSKTPLTDRRIKSITRVRLLGVHPNLCGGMAERLNAPTVNPVPLVRWFKSTSLHHFSLLSKN